MTQLPTGNVPRVAIADPRISPSLAGGPSLLGDIGRAASVVGDVLVRRDEQLAEMERVRRFAATRSEMLIAFAEAEEAARLVDPTESEATSANRLSELKIKVLDNIVNEQDRSILISEFNALAAAAQIGIRQESFKRLATSTVDQLIGFGEIAASQGDQVSVDQTLEQLKSRVTTQRFNDLKAQFDNSVNTSLVEPLKIGIDSFGELPIELRDIREETIRGIIDRSGIPEQEKIALRTRLDIKSRTADSRDVTRIQTLATDLADNATPESVAELESLRKEAELLSGDEKRLVLTDIDAKLRRFPGKINTADILFDAVVNEQDASDLSQSSVDLNTVYNRLLADGRNPTEALRVMLDGGTSIPPRVITDIRNEMTGLGGVKSRGNSLTLAIHDAGRQSVAESIARELDGQTGVESGARAALQGALNARESGLSIESINEIINNPLFVDNIKLARRSIPFDVKNFVIKDNPPSPFSSEDGFFLIQTLKGWLKANLGLPGGADADTERRFIDTYELQYADQIQRNRISVNDRVGQQNAANEARNIALESVKKRFNKAPTKAPVVNLRNALQRRDGGAMAALNSFVGGPGIDTEDVMVRAELIGGKEKEYRAAVFDALNVTFNVSSGGIITTENILRENTLVDPANAFDDNGLTTTPIMRVNQSGTPVETIGFMTFNKFDGSHGVILSESQRPPKVLERDVPIIQFFPLRIDITPAVRFFGGGESFDQAINELDAALNPAPEPEEFFTDIEFDRINKRFQRSVSAESIGQKKGAISSLQNTSGDPNLFVMDGGNEELALTIITKAQFIYMTNLGRPPNDIILDEDRGPIKQITESLSIDLGHAGFERSDTTTNTTR